MIKGQLWHLQVGQVDPGTCVQPSSISITMAEASCKDWWADSIHSTRWGSPVKVSACATCSRGYVMVDGQPLHNVAAPIPPIVRPIWGPGNMSNTGPWGQSLCYICFKILQVSQQYHRSSFLTSSTCFFMQWHLGTQEICWIRRHARLSQPHLPLLLWNTLADEQPPIAASHQSQGIQCKAAKALGGTRQDSQLALARSCWSRIPATIRLKWWKSWASGG